MSFDEVAASLQAEAEEQQQFSCFQISVWSSGERVFLASGGVDGRGAAVSDSSLFRVYCAAKPLLVSAIFRLVEIGELSLNDRIRDILPAVAEPFHDVSVNDILTHSSALPDVPAQDLIARTREVCDRRVFGYEADPNMASGGYNETAGWYALARCVQELSGQSVADFCRQHVPALAGLEDRVDFDPSSGAGGRLRINAAKSASGLVPLLWEEASLGAEFHLPSVGVAASADGLAAFYSRLAGPEPRTDLAAELRRSLDSATPRYHRALDRECAFAVGFMVDLQGHHYSQLHSPRSFGHSGVHGMTFAGADLDFDVAYAVHVNGLSVQGDAEPASRRRRVVSTQLIEAARAL